MSFKIKIKKDNNYEHGTRVYLKGVALRHWGKCLIYFLPMLKVGYRTDASVAGF